EHDKKILLVAQKDASDNDPKPDGIYSIGVIASVLQLLKLPDGTVKVLVEGEERAKVERFTKTDDFFEADAMTTPEIEGEVPETDALARSVVAHFEAYGKLNKRVPPEVIVSINSIDDPAQLADTVASHLNIKIAEKQELLEIFDIGD